MKEKSSKKFVDPQLTLFPISNDQLMNEINSNKELISNVRRGLFKRYNDMNEEIKTLKIEVMELLESIQNIKLAR